MLGGKLGGDAAPISQYVRGAAEIEPDKGAPPEEGRDGFRK